MKKRDFPVEGPALLLQRYYFQSGCAFFHPVEGPALLLQRYNIFRRKANCVKMRKASIPVAFLPLLPVISAILPCDCLKGRDCRSSKHRRGNLVMRLPRFMFRRNGMETVRRKYQNTSVTVKVSRSVPKLPTPGTCQLKPK